VAKFIQLLISPSALHLYALDDEGNVWQVRVDHRGEILVHGSWEQVPGLPEPPAKPESESVYGVWTGESWHSVDDGHGNMKTFLGTFDEAAKIAALCPGVWEVKVHELFRRVAEYRLTS
jgi:hypothetical protein